MHVYIVHMKVVCNYVHFRCAYEIQMYILDVATYTYEIQMYILAKFRCAYEIQMYMHIGNSDVHIQMYT